MYASVRKPFVIDSDWFRWLARMSAAVLVVVWLALLLAEALSARLDVHSGGIYQVVALAIVFAGYSIGWRNELAGSMIAILGTIAYFMVNRVTVGIFPQIEAVWFAAPGLLYLLAWYSEKMRGVSQARQP